MGAAPLTVSAAGPKKAPRKQTPRVARHRAARGEPQGEPSRQHRRWLERQARKQQDKIARRR